MLDEPPCTALFHGKKCRVCGLGPMAGPPELQFKMKGYPFPFQLEGWGMGEGCHAEVPEGRPEVLARPQEGPKKVIEILQKKAL